ncbi:hypothetical protein EY643_16225 [Halioglobus maricola]|uniref:Integrase SAM-like N-terminal domain-containing protein n=1 Tax=Halioglobus maricola TaxID=2601894 RepID=A0A5P9NQ97_9GAMM|nr:hypothetical protein EY643_16225 [Halioglobus maricola]
MFRPLFRESRRRKSNSINSLALDCQAYAIISHEQRPTHCSRGYAYPTERTYLHWIRRYIHFHNKRHPTKMGKADI